MKSYNKEFRPVFLDCEFCGSEPVVFTDKENRKGFFHDGDFVVCPECLETGRMSIGEDVFYIAFYNEYGCWTMDIRISSPNKINKIIEFKGLDDNSLLIRNDESKEIVVELLEAAQKMLSEDAFPYSFVKDLLQSACEFIKEAEGE